MKDRTNMAESSLSLSGIHAQIGFLEGDVLTIVDAAYHNPTQNKAVKDLIKQKFRSKREHITNLANGDTGVGTVEVGGQIRLRRGNNVLIPIGEIRPCKACGAGPGENHTFDCAEAQD